VFGAPYTFDQDNLGEMTVRSNNQSHPPLKVHRATFCLPEALPDRRLGDAIRSLAAGKPLLVVGVSGGFYSSVGDAGDEHSVSLSAQGASTPDVLILRLQFGSHQLRCVMSLCRPLVQQWLETARRRGKFPMVIFETEGHRYAGLECDVEVDEVKAIVEPGLPDPCDASDCRAVLSYAALRCLLVDELPSIVPAMALRHVDVALVEEGAFLTSEPMN
jgi:hypothetical protein